MLLKVNRDLVLKAFRNTISYLNHFIITSKYKFSYLGSPRYRSLRYNLCLKAITTSTDLFERNEEILKVSHSRLLGS